MDITAIWGHVRSSIRSSPEDTTKPEIVKFYAEINRDTVTLEFLVKDNVATDAVKLYYREPDGEWSPVDEVKVNARRNLDAWSSYDWDISEFSEGLMK